MSDALRKSYCIVPAAGIGARYAQDIPKQYYPLLGKPILQHTLERLLSLDTTLPITVALHPDDHWFHQLSLATHPRIQTVTGGATRAESVWLSLQSLKAHAQPMDWIVVHDAVRPALSKAAWDRLWDTLAAPTTTVGALLAVPVQDTLKQVDTQHQVLATQAREHLWQAQTPQVFSFETLYRALEQFVDDASITDEASAVEKLGLKPHVVLGDRGNWKLTAPGDEYILSAALRKENQMRIGHGFDIHRLTPGNGFMLGGVFLPGDYTVIAHSDGDALIHAICDALLGALALGDIGQHFPDTDPTYKNADSSLFLTTIMGWVKEKRYQIGNLDVTIITEYPKLKPVLLTLRQHLQTLLGCDMDCISLKAKTHEGLDSIGQRQAIAVHCVVCLTPL